MERVAAGEADALRELSRRYSRTLLALSMRIVGDELDAEEITADALWQAWREARGFDPRRGSVGSWLVMVARSRAIDRLRAKAARQPVAHAIIDTGGQAPDPAQTLYSEERRQRIRAALVVLNENERVLLELAYYADLSQSEIAERMKLPLGTVKTRLRSAMIKLRAALNGRQD